MKDKRACNSDRFRCSFVVHIYVDVEVTIRNHFAHPAFGGPRNRRPGMWCMVEDAACEARRRAGRAGWLAGRQPGGQRGGSFGGVHRVKGGVASYVLSICGRAPLGSVKAFPCALRRTNA